MRRKKISTLLLLAALFSLFFSSCFKRDKMVNEISNNNDTVDYKEIVNIEKRYVNKISSLYEGDFYIDENNNLCMINMKLGVLTNFGFIPNENSYDDESYENIISKYKVPTIIMQNVKHIAGNMEHLMILTVDGDLYGMGKSWFGVLLENDHDATYPKIYSEPKLLMTDVLYVSNKGFHVMALKTDGSLYTWGNNYNGQIGNGESSQTEHNKDIILEKQYDVYNPFYVYIPTKIMEDVIWIESGNFISSAIRSDGSLWMWGDNSCGLIGNGEVGNKLPTVSNLMVASPIKIMNNTIDVWVEETQRSELTNKNNDHYNVYCMDIDNNVYAWGEDYNCTPTKQK